MTHKEEVPMTLCSEYLILSYGEEREGETDMWGPRPFRVPYIIHYESKK